MYRFAEPADVAGGERRATLLFSGPMWQVAMEARALLAADWGVSADAWSVTSYTELREDALSIERANRLHPHAERAVPYVSRSLEDGAGPVVAVTDYLRAVPDQVARWVPRPFVSLGTDGFGRSDTRAALRRFFEVDAAHVVVAVLSALAETGDAKPDEVAEAISRYEIDADSTDPWSD
jgi:pyruvate dehydrogenase E1 component